MRRSGRTSDGEDTNTRTVRFSLISFRLPTDLSGQQCDFSARTRLSASHVNRSLIPGHPYFANVGSQPAPGPPRGRALTSPLATRSQKLVAVLLPHLGAVRFCELDHV